MTLRVDTKGWHTGRFCLTPCLAREWLRVWALGPHCLSSNPRDSTASHVTLSKLHHFSDLKLSYLERIIIPIPRFVGKTVNPVCLEYFVLMFCFHVAP